MLAIVNTCAVVGLDGNIIEVQTDFNPRAQLPRFNLVGLPGLAVRESRERARSAIRNSGLRFPNKAYTVNLSPADIPKQGTAYDLSIAVSVLAATDQIPLHVLDGAMFIGELSLDGNIRHVKGVLPMAYTAQQAGLHTVYVPEDDAAEAAIVDDINIIPLRSLGQLVEHLYHLNPIEPYRRKGSLEDYLLDAPLADWQVDFASVRGQESVKRALEIAAAGHHHVMMSGPPGAGKSLMAKALSSILPPLVKQEAIEVTRIYSVADMLGQYGSLVRQRPIRQPHHNISEVGLVGGGSIPKPGEISLAHRGVLFLDELNELPRKILEAMRQPMEDKQITVSRAAGRVTFPANFLLVGARNPCPCGHLGDPHHTCRCSPNQINQYQSRISGPIMDRIDMHVEVPPVDFDKLAKLGNGESSAAIRQRVTKARQVQLNRFADLPGIFANGDMGVAEIDEFCAQSDEVAAVLQMSAKKFGFSARGYFRSLRLARTIADLDESADIGAEHILEAVQYRARTSE